MSICLFIVVLGANIPDYTNIPLEKDEISIPIETTDKTNKNVPLDVQSKVDYILKIYDDIQQKKLLPFSFHYELKHKY
jgi:hypothetical protein